MNITTYRGGFDPPKGDNYKFIQNDKIYTI